MENASKALIMAAGMLVGMIILSIFVYEMVFISDTAKTYEKEIESSQITEFNNQFEVYFNRDLNAQDVVAIYNLTQDWNEKNESDQVTLFFSLSIRGYFDTSPDVEGFLNDYITEVATDDWSVDNLYVFRCESPIYGDTGRINSINIRKI